MAASTLPVPWNPFGLTDLESESVVELPTLTVPGWKIMHMRAPEKLRRLRIMMPGKLEVETDSPELPNWIFSVLRKFPDLLRLPNDWNGPDSPRIEPAVLASAVKSLATFMQARSSAPEVTPTVRGGVQFDWHENGIDLEVEYVPGQWDGDALFSDRSGELEEWDGRVSENLDRLTTVFNTRLHAGPEG